MEDNRRVDEARAKKFADYLLRSKDWVSPAIIVRVPPQEVSFQPKATFADQTAWGVLSIPRDVLTEVVLLDGQHRTLGVFLALETLNARIQRFRKTIDDMRRQGVDQAGILDQERRLESDLGIKKRLGNEHISIDIAEVRSGPARQMFGDINNNAKGVNPDFRTILDQRDVVNRIALMLIESNVLLQDRVEYGQSTKMTPSNANLVGAKGVADITRAILVGSGRVGARVQDEIEKSIEASRKNVNQFFEVLVAAFDDLRDVVENRLDPIELREKSMLGSVTMLRILAIVYHDLTTGNHDDGVAPWSRAQVEDFFRSLAPHMTRIPISVEDKLWMETGAFMPNGNAPMARQGSIAALSRALESWARNGFPQH